MGVLQPGQRLRLAGAGARDLEGHQAVRQVPLLGEEDPGDPAPAELVEQSEATDRLADRRERDGQWGGLLPGQPAHGAPDEFVQVEDLADLARDRGEPGLVLGRVGGFSGLLAEAKLLIDEGDQHVLGELREAAEISLDARRLAGLPAQAQIGAKQGQEGRCAPIRLVW